MIARFILPFELPQVVLMAVALNVGPLVLVTEIVVVAAQLLTSLTVTE